MKTAVITVVHGRTTHLRNQLRGLRGSHQPPEQHVIVAVEDPTVTDTVADCGAHATVVPCHAPGAHLPVAHARNLGAHTALGEGAELLVFLDVDCIPAASPWPTPAVGLQVQESTAEVPGLESNLDRTCLGIDLQLSFFHCRATGLVLKE